ncbi:MAG: hypothetical protein V4726_24770 [Verrucomicrobiota bacterium]
MPISSTVDYIPVMDEFLAHWGALPEPLKLPEGETAVGFVEFTALRVELDVAKTELQRKLNDLEAARVHLEQARITGGDRIAEFNRRIRAEFPNTPGLSRLPAVPARTAGRDAFLDAMDDALDLWNRVNALPPGPVFTAPLLLRGGLSRDQLLAMRVGLDRAFTQRGAADAAVFSQRLVRNLLQDRAKSLMILYRMKIEALHAPESFQVATLPRVTPLPGSTPEPVALTAEWNEEAGRAELTWTASEEPDLASYQVRGVPGPEYSAEDETLMATLPPGGPRVWHSIAGLAVPGSAMSYKLYVRLATGHEAGSAPGTVTRPG